MKFQDNAILTDQISSKSKRRISESIAQVSNRRFHGWETKLGANQISNHKNPNKQRKSQTKTDTDRGKNRLKKWHEKFQEPKQQRKTKHIERLKNIPSKSLESERWIEILVKLSLSLCKGSKRSGALCRLESIEAFEDERSGRDCVRFLIYSEESLFLNKLINIYFTYAYLELDSWKCWYRIC